MKNRVGKLFQRAGLLVVLTFVAGMVHGFNHGCKITRERLEHQLAATA